MSNFLSLIFSVSSIILNTENNLISKSLFRRF